MPRLRDTQAKLLETLKDLERNKRSFTVGDLVTRTGYSEGTVKTYIAKKLVDRYVFRTDVDGHFEVKGITSVTDADFAVLMSQKDSLDEIERHLAHLTKPEWERAVEILIEAGQERGYDTTAVLERLLDRVP